MKADLRLKNIRHALRPIGHRVTIDPGGSAERARPYRREDCWRYDKREIFCSCPAAPVIIGGRARRD